MKGRMREEEEKGKNTSEGLMKGRKRKTEGRGRKERKE